MNEKERTQYAIRRDTQLWCRPNVWNSAETQLENIRNIWWTMKSERRNLRKLVGEFDKPKEIISHKWEGIKWNSNKIS